VAQAPQGEEVIFRGWLAGWMIIVALLAWGFWLAH
jgi:hypothetical protein